MVTYISMLRGINVSGQKKILMADLKKLYEDLKFKNVVTYIQSGNVIFDSDKKLTDIQAAEKIKKKIFEKYNYEVHVVIRNLKELENTVKVNPCLKIKNVDLSRLYVAFFSEVPDKALLEALNKLDFSPDNFSVIGKEVYLYLPTGAAETKLTNNFLEKKLKVSATTRNWNTVNKLIELTGKKNL